MCSAGRRSEEPAELEHRDCDRDRDNMLWSARIVATVVIETIGSSGTLELIRWPSRSVPRERPSTSYGTRFSTRRTSHSELMSRPALSRTTLMLVAVEAFYSTGDDA